MDEVMIKLKILARAELMLAKANLRRTAVRGSLVGIALGLVLLAALMLNIGLYELFTDRYGPASGAFLVALLNVGLALLAMLATRLIRPGPEIAMVEEIREMALAELSTDVGEVRDDFLKIRDDIENIRTGFTAFTSGGGTSIASLMPLITLAIDALKRMSK